VPRSQREKIVDEAISNFTPRAQQVLALARQEADRLNHNFVGTEHVLLGLIRLGQGTAVNVLQKMGLDLETVRTEVEKQVGTGPDQKMVGAIPYTPRVKKVLSLAAKEAKALNHNYVGTEHLLLGLLREGDGVAARVLENLNVDIEQTRLEILNELDPNFIPDTDAGGAPRITLASRPTSPGERVAKPSSIPLRQPVDISKRYDVYCADPKEEVVVYRNVLLKGIRTLLRTYEHDTASEFLELEQADGRTIFVARASVIRFSEPDAATGTGPTP
jgi:hypothetical protein